MTVTKQLIDSLLADYKRHPCCAGLATCDCLNATPRALIFMGRNLGHNLNELKGTQLSIPKSRVVSQAGSTTGESKVSFQAYLDNIHAKTGKTPEQFKSLATKAGVYTPDMKANALVAWLKDEFDLGHGHSMAIWAVFKDKGWVEAPRTKK